MRERRKEPDQNMKKVTGYILASTAAVLALLAGAYVFYQRSLPQKADFAGLVEPRISQMPDITILRADFEGDANTVISGAYDRLFKVYYRLDGVEKGPKAPPPLARYEGFASIKDFSNTEELKKLPWKGFVAIQVPDGTNLPADAASSGVRLDRLSYGTTAEIVHFGSYETEHPTIGRLHDYIKRSGYEISGLHEEQYYIGPGMPIPAKPENYITVIRYSVRKR